MTNVERRQEHRRLYGRHWGRFSRHFKWRRRCEKCGEDGYRETAHLLSTRLFPYPHPLVHDPRNLVVLCQGCHRTFDNIIGAWGPRYKARDRHLAPLFRELIVRRAYLLAEFIADLPA